MYYAKDGLKTVAEVEKITGLKRRELYSYRGIVEPADTLKSSSYMLDNGKFCEGYKMYDDKGIKSIIGGDRPAQIYGNGKPYYRSSCCRRFEKVRKACFGCL